MDSKCPNGHQKSYKCHEQPPLTCSECERERKLAERKKQAALKLQQKRDAEQLEHAKKLAEINEEIEALSQARRDAQLSQDRENAIRQKEKDLEAAKAQIVKVAVLTPGNAQATPATSSKLTVSKSGMTPTDLGIASVQDKMPNTSDAPASSPSRDEWQRRKMMDGADNEHIDAIMEMTGLEEVKEQVLNIKDKVDMSIMQGTTVKDERFHIVLLGNPGTGID